MAFLITCPTHLPFGTNPHGRKKFKALEFHVQNIGGHPIGGDVSIEVQIDAGHIAFRADYLSMLVGTKWEWAKSTDGNSVHSTVFSLALGETRIFKAFVAIGKSHGGGSDSTPIGSHSGKLRVRLSGGGLADSIVDLDGAIAAASPTRLAIVLDRSESMAQLTSANVSRSQRMKESALVCLPFLNNADQLAIVDFDAAANVRIPIGPLSGTIGGVTRRALAQALLSEPGVASATASSSGAGNGAEPNTSIREGVLRTNAELGGATPRNALLLSDGVNNLSTTVDLPPGVTWSAVGIADKLSFHEKVVSTQNLNNVAGIGRVLTWTEATGPFRLEKYVTQALLGILGSGILLDPDGTLSSSHAHVFDFDVTEADETFDIVAFCERPELLHVAVAPSEKLHGGCQDSIDETLPVLSPLCEEDRLPKHKVRRDESYYQSSKRQPPGKEDESECDSADDSPDRVGHRVFVHRVSSLPTDSHRPSRLSVRLAAPELKGKQGLPYTLLVATQSDLKLDAALHSDDLYVGAELLFSAVLTQFEQRLSDRVAVTVLVLYPDGDTQTYDMEQTRPGRFELRVPTLRPGSYEARFIARGRSLLGRPFRRESLQTVTILPAAARLDPPPAPASPSHRDQTCE